MGVLGKIALPLSFLCTHTQKYFGTFIHLFFHSPLCMCSIIRTLLTQTSFASNFLSFAAICVPIHRLCRHKHHSRVILIRCGVCVPICGLCWHKHHSHIISTRYCCVRNGCAYMDSTTRTCSSHVAGNAKFNSLTPFSNSLRCAHSFATSSIFSPKSRATHAASIRVQISLHT